MKNNILVLFFLLFFAQFVAAQQNVQKKLKGQITLNTNPVESVGITNTKNKLSAVSDQNGNFFITAKEGDTLKFYAAGFEPLSKIISKHEFGSGLLVVSMTAENIELKEVIINGYPEITAEKLGIIRPGQIKFTPAERKLYSGSGGIVGFINLLTGELKNLKANVEVEKKEIVLRKLDFLFEDKYYAEDLKIPNELIKGFKYYCVEDPEFAKAVNSKNKTMCMFLIIQLASNYNKIRFSDANTE